MEMIELKGTSELLKKEEIDNIPELVRHYLEMKKRSKGKYFRILIEKKNTPTSNAGIAYSNALIIKKKTKEGWIKVYDTGMLQYRGAHNYEIDNWDFCFNDPSIIKESEKELVFGLRTGAGNAKIYRLRDEGEDICPETLVAFNINEHKAQCKRIKLIQKVITDYSSFCEYIEAKFPYKSYWKIEKKKLLNDRVGIILVAHVDRDYDAIVDRYCLYFWVKNKGIGDTRVFFTGLYHPLFAQFYYIGLSLDAEIDQDQSNVVNVRVFNSRQKWEKKHKIMWEE